MTARRLRIGLVVPGFSADEHDWWIPALRDLVVGLREHIDPTVFALRYPHSTSPYRVFDVPVVPFGGAEARRFGRLPMIVRATRAVRASLLTGQLDGVHALWAHEPGLVATVACAGTGRRPLVSLLGGELADLPDIGYGGQISRFNRWASNLALRHAHAVTVGSESLRDLGAQRGYAVAGWHRLPLGVDTRKFSPQGAPGNAPLLDGHPCLLSVGALIPVKGPELLLECFAAVYQQLPGARLHLIGEGALRQRLVETVRSMDLVAGVRFHGAIDHVDMPGVYRQADVVMVTSHFESQSVAAVEAAACGRTLIGPAVGVLPEIDGAEICVSHAPSAIAAALLQALSDRNLLRHRGARGRDWVLREATVDNTVGKLVQLYEEVTRQ